MDQTPMLDTLLEQADALAAAGKAADAYAAARRALELRPDARRVLLLACRLAMTAGETDAAIGHAREATLLDSGDPEAALLLGQAALAVGALPEAIESLQRAVRLTPEDPAARLLLGRAWLAAAEPNKAMPHLERAMALDPDGSHDIRAWLAVAAAEATSALPPDFVRTLFDQYADRFDSELRNVLGYRAPENLAALVERVIGSPRRDLDILDLGCGTGLSGEAFRPFARTIVGIDLSPRMAEKARARKLYDRVEVGDMMPFLNNASPCHAVIAVDTLVYVRDLAPIFKAAKVALRPNGWIAATVEKNDNPQDVVLSPARRFRHGEMYIRQTADAAGLACAAIEDVALRQDRNQPVTGLAFILIRTGA